ncbi:MAG: hypothetical protein HRT89_09910, partial [Lentisphaeria bacterium]|nr:hypothetical protein [Lentisphaeria bacterium]
MSQKAKKHIWTFIRCGLGFSLSGLLLYKIISSSKIDLAKEFSRINITWFIIAILLYGVAVFVSFFRWQKLLEVLDV